MIEKCQELTVKKEGMLVEPLELDKKPNPTQKKGVCEHWVPSLFGL